MARIPNAPGLFSTTNCWPRLFFIWSPKTREVMSVPPPGAYGTMIFTGFDGYLSCANAGPPTASAKVDSSSNVGRFMSVLRAFLCSSIRLQPGRFRQHGVVGNFLLDQRVEFGRRHRHRGDVEPGKPLPQ